MISQELERRLLAASLIEELQRSPSPLALGAWDRWAEHPDCRAEWAESIDEAVTNAAGAFARIGFTVTFTPDGDQLELAGCPYKDLTAGQAAVCSIHAALLRCLLSASGQPVSLAEVDIDLGPGPCTAHLKRGDRRTTS